MVTSESSLTKPWSLGSRHQQHAVHLVMSRHWGWMAKMNWLVGKLAAAVLVQLIDIKLSSPKRGVQHISSRVYRLQSLLYWSMHPSQSVAESACFMTDNFQLSPPKMHLETVIIHAGFGISIAGIICNMLPNINMILLSSFILNPNFKF
jgi:hypothetical protein